MVRHLDAEEQPDGQGAIVVADGEVAGRIVPDGAGAFRIDVPGVAGPIVGASPRDAWNHLLGAVRAGQVTGIVVGAFRDAGEPAA